MAPAETAAKWAAGVEKCPGIAGGKKTGPGGSRHS